MKKIVLVLSLVFAFVNGTFASKKNEEKESNHSAHAARIAFVGVDLVNFRSNYLSQDVIADKLSVEEDSIDNAFNQDFYNALYEICQKKGQYEIVYCCYADGKNLLDRINYQEKGDEMYSDISGVSQEDFNSIINSADADYVALIDQYYIKKEGYPYHNLSHIINYSVFDKNKNKISEGCHRFTSLEMENLNEYSKQFTKAADKLLAKIEK